MKEDRVDRRKMLRIGALFAVAALLVAACGKETVTATKGGTLKVIANGDVDYMDPGQTYYAQGYMVMRVMIRNLLTFPASTAQDPGTHLVADLATDMGKLSDGGKTYTYTLRRGVKYPPNVAGGREITSADIRYGIERGLSPKLANGYVGLYFKDLFVGQADFEKKKTTHIAGIDVGDPHTIVFHLTAPTGDFPYRLALPVTAPVPEEYAKPFDAKTPPTYGPNLAASGPYMLERKNGKVTGWVPAKKIILVRNPNWDASTDPVRKAYPDRIEITEGFTDENVAIQKILNGQFDVPATDMGIPAPQLKKIVGNATLKKRLAFNHYSGVIYYIFMNTTLKPFDNVYVRRAVNTVLDKSAMRLAFGGPLKGDIATNVLMPGVTGFDAVGGAKYDPYGSPGQRGDVTKAIALMKKAGYPSGKYTGPPVLSVNGTGVINKAIDDVMGASLAKIGIKLKREVYDPNIMFTKYYSVPSAKVQLGPGAGWIMDYPDGITVLKALHDGRLITPSANNNLSQLNDPKVNALIDKAVALSGEDRSKAWADVCRAIMNDADVVPFVWATIPMVWSARVPHADFTLAVGGIDLGTVSVNTNP